MVSESTAAVYPEDRLRNAYARRDLRLSVDHYSVFNPANLFLQQSRDRAMLRMLKRNGISSFAGLRILDVGCGAGGMLRAFNRWGADPVNLCGVDLLQNRIDEARRLSPAIEFRCVSAVGLPFEDTSFDLVSHFALFDTILEREVRQAVAREMIRVVRNEGAILWYDFRVNNPRNRDTRRIGKREISELFAGCEIQLATTTLAPPVARLLARRAWLLASVLEKIPLLCTHYLGIIKSPAASLRATSYARMA